MIRPGEAPIKKRELLEIHGLDGVIEPASFLVIEVTVGPVIRRSDEIEVTKNDPGAGEGRLKLNQVI